MIIANELRVGNIIEMDNQVWVVNKREHVKPGKGGAFIQAELKNIKNGSKSNTRFRSDQTINKLSFVELPVTFLYKTDSVLEFMDMVTCEQISIGIDIAGDKVHFLNDGDEVKLAKVGEDYVDLILPDSVVLEVIETQPYLKGKTITATFKPAKLSNGLVVNVPQFIVEGEKILVRTSDLEYIERYKEDERRNEEG